MMTKTSQYFRSKKKKVVSNTAKDNDRKRVKGIGHAFMSNGECSKRTRKAKECTDRGNSSAIDKIADLRNIDGIGITLKVSEDDTNNFRAYLDDSKMIGKDQIFFSGKKNLSDDDHIHQQCQDATLIGLVNHEESSPIKVYDDAKALNGGIACINETTNQFVFLLVPRGKVCGKNQVVSSTNPTNYLDALDDVEACERNCHGKRGNLRHVVFEGLSGNENYQNLFVKADRGGKGLVQHIPKQLKETSVNLIRKWKNYISAIVDDMVPNDILKGVRAAIVGNLLNTQNVTPKRPQKDCLEDGEIFEPVYMEEEENRFHSMPKLDLLPTLAVSRNVALSMHTDNDASLSVVIVYRRQDIDDRQTPKRFCRMAEILKYFTFGCGISIGLRSGDVLIFNPQIEHCISTNTDTCIESGVMTTSHYYKSSVIGLNDNSIRIKQEE